MELQSDFGAAISQPYEWHACPGEVERLRVRIANEIYHTLLTEGGGACGFHALWGQPNSTRDSHRIELGQTNVRGKVVSSLPQSWSDVCRVRHGVLQPILQRMVDQMWKDLLSDRVTDKREKHREGSFATAGSGSSGCTPCCSSREGLRRC